MIGKLGITAMAAVLAFGITQDAQASAVGTADAVITSQFVGVDNPFIFEDTNWNLNLQQIGNDLVIAGFIDFEFVSSSPSTVPPTPIRDAGEGAGKAAFDTVELTGFFAARLIGLGANPELGAAGSAATPLLTGYYAPISDGTDLSVMFGQAAGSVIWDVDDAGTMVQVFADLADNFDASSPVSAYTTTVDGEDFAEIGFTGPASATATYAAGDEYFANVFPVIPPPVPTLGDITNPADGSPIAPSRVLVSLNVLNTTSAVLNGVLDNDTGNNFYAEGDNVAGAANGFFFQGDVDAKILSNPVPLPAAVWAGLPLLGFAAGIRRRITRS